MIATSRAIRAGLRTTILVALAACLSMVQARWLMNSVGKAPNSFVVLDLMRLPLGILTGVGFIGGGISNAATAFKASRRLRPYGS